jgi:FtsH-binding integral membrane protein
MDIDKEKSYESVSGRSDVFAQGFMQRVYLWMTIGLAVTGAVSYYVSTSETILTALFGNGVFPIIALVVVELGLVFYLSARVMTLNPSTASALFFVYSALNGLTIAPIFLIYTSESISSTFFISAGVFGGMCVYGSVTKRDLSEWGSFLIMGLWGIIIASLVNMFIGSEKTSLVISIMAVIIFTGLTAFDTQKLRRIAAEGYGEDVRDNLAVLGALTLYLDFINIFLHLLRLMGKRK